MYPFDRVCAKNATFKIAKGVVKREGEDVCRDCQLARS